MPYYEREPVVHEPYAKTGTWIRHDGTSWKDTGRPYNTAGNQVRPTTFTEGGRNSRRSTRNRGHSKKHKRVHHTRRKHTRRHRHRHRR